MLLPLDVFRLILNHMQSPLDITNAILCSKKLYSTFNQHPTLKTWSSYCMGYALKEASVVGCNLAECFSADSWRSGWYGAPLGHLHHLEIVANKDAPNWDGGMYRAALCGLQHLVEFFINKGADDWVLGLYGAALGGHLHLVEFFINKGVTHWRVGMEGAAQGGHQHIVDFLQRKIDETVQ